MKSFIFLKIYIFEGLLIFESLMLQIYIANITFNLFTKCCFRPWFYNIIKKQQKEKKEWYIYEEKNRGKIKTVTP